jgi:hypothetical protein
MPPTSRKPSASNASPPGDSAWSLLDSVALALFVARWLVPAEGVARGETLWIAQGWTIWASFAAFRSWQFGGHWNLRMTGLATGTVALIAGHVVSALVVCATEGQKRAALNGMWEWVSVGVALCWVAAGAKHAQFRRVVVVSIVSVAVTSGLLGLWQRHVWQPRLAGWITEYDKLEVDVRTLSGPEKRAAERRLTVLRDELGPEYVSLDSNGRFALRQRVQFSTEPLGRFALANTLASLLAVGFVLGLPSLSAPASSRGKWLSVAVLLLLAYVLLLTKSRTAMIAAAYGTITFLLLAFGLWSPRLARWLGGCTATIAILIGVAWMTGGLDRLVISEAPKSLQYRMEYWKSSAEVVREHPWLGVGPGNFRQHYLRYKLPESSEEILDPHNLLLDAWVSGGLLAALAVIGLALIGMRSLRIEIPADMIDPKTSGMGRCAAVAILLSAMLVAIERWVFDGIVDQQVLLLGAGGAVFGWMLSRPAIPGGRMEFAAISAAWLTLTVHLLGAGGMEMPAVIQIWLSLLCLRTAWKPARQLTIRSISSRGILCVALICTLAAAAQWSTATLPVLNCRMYFEAAEGAMLSGRFRSAEQLLRDAIAADRLNPEPRRRLAQVSLATWVESGDQRDFDLAIQQQQAALARDPASPHDHRILGEMFLRKFGKDQDKDSAQQAVRWLTSASKMYPNHAPTNAALARAFDAAGDKSHATEAAAKAIQLDALNRELGHYDRLLPDSDLPELKALAE